MKNKADLIDVIAHDHMIGANALFAFYSSSDLHNADTVIAYLDQGGLSCPTATTTSRTTTSIKRCASIWSTT